MPSGQYAVALTIGGISTSKSIVRTGDHPNPYSVNLPSGQSGTIASVDAPNNTCNVTLSAGHGIANTETVDLYWSTSNLRYGMTASAVNATQATLSDGTGDTLPSVNTSVVATEQVEINTQIDGDNIQILGIVAEYTDENSTSKAHIDMQDSGNATIEEIDLTANQPRIYDITGGDTNVFTGNPITHSYASNGDSSANATLKILSLEDSTP